MLTNILGKRWVQFAVLLALLLTASYVRFLSPDFIMQIQRLTFDEYNRAFPRDPEAEYKDVVIVDIDEESLKRVGQWPWPRSQTAEMPVILSSMGAQVVAFDMAFSEPDRLSPSRVAANLPQTPELASVVDALKKLPDNDEVMAQKVAEAGNVVTGFVREDSATDGVPVRKATLCGDTAPPFGENHPGRVLQAIEYFVVTLPNITAASVGNGLFTAAPDTDGIIRNVPLLAAATEIRNKTRIIRDIVPALSLEAFRVSKRDAARQMEQNHQCSGYSIKLDQSGLIQAVRMGAGKIVPTNHAGEIRVYYHGHQPDIYIPAWQVLERKVDPARVKDKIVLIGTSSIGLLDLRSSPINKILPGVEIHAEIIEQLMHDQYLVENPDAKAREMLFAVVASLLIVFFMPRISGGLMALLTLVVLSGWIGLSILAYKQGELVDPVFPSAIIVVIFVMSSILTNLRTEMEKRMIRQAFDRYLSPALIEELVKDPSRLKLGGDVRELSVMFTDIRNFTTISESMDPAELIRMMNDFLTPMTSAVLDNKGFVDKYMGDAMMTFWNAPVDDSYHAHNACKASLEMIEALKPVNADLRARAEKAGRVFHELKAGIGINSGRASVGNMGSKQRFAYSALGDTVNLASRLEGQTKVYGITCMIAQSTRTLVPDMACIELDLLTVKGRAEPERVHALLGDENMAKTEAFRKFSSLHTRVLEAYRARKWDEASALMTECVALRPDLAALYHLYATRIGVYKEHPPAEDWTGVWVAKEK